MAEGRSCRYDPAAMMPYGSARRINAPPSPRELDVLAILARGESNQEAATALGISINTVKHHVSRLIRHANAVNLAGVLFALGWTQVPDQPGRDVQAAVRWAEAAKAELDATLAKAQEGND